MTVSTIETLVQDSSCEGILREYLRVASIKVDDKHSYRRLGYVGFDIKQR